MVYLRESVEIIPHEIMVRYGIGLIIPRLDDSSQCLRCKKGHSMGHRSDNPATYKNQAVQFASI